MSGIQKYSFPNRSLATYDPFADTGDTTEVTVQGYIHIRIQQRNGRKTITTVQGLPVVIDQKKLVKAFKKDEEWGDVIQLSGDQRQKVTDFLVAEGISKKDKIKIHGF
ncbi:Eukaryotic translation initiation factor eIF-1 [Boothiomyces macroporosus]|uniref:Eukaryotic translation initiation factor eIF-1 n=1 Tax=Boothiomyces macroporosus TaxID=261099 RepID=A0AAD5UKQ8_9FUNG|nr:Eukaryotic translation initiation factor eIF-1 [Boothiomyces macroporosus]